MSNLEHYHSYLDKMLSQLGDGCECYRPVFLDMARSELAALRARVAELEASRANQADSLRHWSDLWTHIVTRLGSVDELPTAANFDALLLPWALD